MSDAIDMVLSDFIDAWNAGRRPRVDDYLARVAPAERAELAEQIENWLLMAPTPDYSERDARAGSAPSRPCAGALAEIAPEPELWPEVLPRLRERAGLRLRDLAARVTAAFGLGGRGGARRVATSSGWSAASSTRARVSRRLLDALGTALGADLADAAGGAAPAAAPGQALFRAEEEAGAELRGRARDRCRARR